MTDVVVYKPATIAKTFELDWPARIVNSWRRDYDFAQGAIIRPHVGNGYLYEATTAGKSSELIPDFMPGGGETTVDGSIVWTARHPSSPTLEVISNSDWALDTGITEDSKSVSGLKTLITVSGGVAGEQYRMTNTITLSSGDVEVQSIVLEIDLLADV